MPTAIVLAGSRDGAADPMASREGVPHKALLAVGGVPMLQRVLEALRAVGAFDRIVVCGHDPALLLAACGDTGGVLPRPQAASPCLSVSAMLEEFGAPLLVTTADHALLTADMVSCLLRAAPADADLVAGIATRTVVAGAYPETARTWLRFRDATVSGCNLFLLRTGRARGVLRFWRRVEQARKRPATIARLLGPVALLLHATRLGSLEGSLRRLGRRTGATLATVSLPFAEAAIDVDKPSDLLLVRRIVARRSAA